MYVNENCYLFYFCIYCVIICIFNIFNINYNIFDIICLISDKCNKF